MCSGHLGSHAGRYSALAVLLILLYLTMKYYAMLRMEIDQRNQSSVLRTCKFTVRLGQSLKILKPLKACIIE